MKIVKQRVALWQVSPISIVGGRGGNKKSVSITPIVNVDHHRDHQSNDEDGEGGGDGEDGEE